MNARSWLLALCLAACDGSHGDEAREAQEAHGHDHGPDAISVTRWTDTHELFLEYPPAVVGQAVELLAHVTVLHGFRALSEGPATLVLTGPQPTRLVAAEPRAPGIFVFAFTPAAAGRYDAVLEVPGGSIDGVAIEVLARAPTEGDRGEAGEHASRIDFLKEQQWRVPFATVEVTSRVLAPSVEVAGSVTTPPGGNAEVGAPLAGRVILPAGGLVRPGDTVTAGTLLASIAPAPSAPEDAARASLAVAEAEARIAQARSDLERAERLMRDRAISPRELENARREVTVAEQAQRAAASARQLLRGGGGGATAWLLTAPIGGVVTAVDAMPGATVSAGDVLFRILDPRELWIRADVPEQDAVRLTDGDAAYAPSGSDAWRPLRVSGEEANASRVFVGRVVDPSTRTVEVVYGLRAPDAALRVGGLVRVALPVGEPIAALAVPRAAVIEDEGRSLVYVQVQGEAFEERAVRVGPRAGEWIAITEGLAAGERIVTEGVTLVRLAGRASTGGGHGHVH